MLRLAQLEQPPSHQWRNCQIEGQSSLFTGELLRLLFALTRCKMREICERQAEGLRLSNKLNWLRVYDGERCTQGLVATQQFGEGLLQGMEVECAGEADGSGDVISDVAGFELIEKPESLLREGGRQKPFPLDAFYGGGWRVPLPL